MPSKNPRQSLQDILDHIDLIQGNMSGVTYKQYVADAVKRAATERWIQNITEAGFRLGDQAAELCPDINWADIRGLGNRLRHAYDFIDAERVFNVIQNDLPLLQRSATAALSQLQASGSE